ncbi:MAG: S1 RNA-binding domain-containing protein, partial [Chromatiales bacterium]|nr:S1 RNA-binding domain-containing protein [Chromatiales bacterium]
HISQMSDRRIERTSDVVKVGDSVSVRVMEVDGRGRIRLTMRGLQEGGAASGDDAGRRRPRRRRRAQG